MTKSEVRAKMKECGRTMKELAFQSSYSTSFMTQLFANPNSPAVHLPERVYEVLRVWGIVERPQKESFPPSERQLEYLKVLGATSVPANMLEASTLIAELKAQHEAAKCGI